jgi:hypothetical protein
MKITLGELKAAISGLNKIVVATLSIKVSYRLSKMITIINNELAHEEQLRQKLVTQYGEKDDKGNIQVKKENATKFYEDYRKLLEEEVKLNIQSIKLSEIQDVKISAMDILALGKLLEDDVSEPKK